MKCGLILSAFVAAVSALRIADGAVKVDRSVTYTMGPEPVPLDVMNRDLDFSFKLYQDEVDEPVERPGPQQVSVILYADELKGQAYYYPRYDLNDDTYRLHLKVNEVSPFLRAQEAIWVRILVGDTDPQNNLVHTVAELVPTKKLHNDLKAQMPERFGAKPEIHHIFGGDSKQAPVVVSAAFVAQVLAVFGALIFAWKSFDATNLDNKSKVNAVPFIGCLVGFELVFFAYYRGSSIFVTLARVAVIALGAAYFGSRVLQSLYKLREAGSR